jgi:hypothetical protein
MKIKMKLVKGEKPVKRFNYEHRISFNNKKYIRRETFICKPHGFISGENFHIINWEIILGKGIDEKCTGIEFYYGHRGWVIDNKFKKSNPVPEIEKVFKETVGKDLFYF